MSAHLLPFTAPWLLAPMEGVTEPCFRELVFARNPSTSLGGGFTEFARVVSEPLSRRSLREHLGTARFQAPVGLQLMGSDVASLAETARRAVEVGAPLVDLNFGCPAKGALRTCAGSALLKHPAQIERIIAACVAAAAIVPVTAKIRAGYDDATQLEDLARAVEAGGAALVTIHCRTRLEAYRDEVDWRRIARVVAAVSIPVCGNGGVRSHADFQRMRDETGCAFTMVGRAALGDPWIFSGRRATTSEAASFLLEYADTLVSATTCTLHGATGRVKQLLAHWTAGELVGDDRLSWMREGDAQHLIDRLGVLAQGDAHESSYASSAICVQPQAHVGIALEHRDLAIELM